MNFSAIATTAVADSGCLSNSCRCMLVDFDIAAVNKYPFPIGEFGQGIEYALKNPFLRPSMEEAQQGIAFTEKRRDVFPRYAGSDAVKYAFYFEAQIFLVVNA